MEGVRKMQFESPRKNAASNFVFKLYGCDSMLVLL